MCSEPNKINADLQQSRLRQTPLHLAVCTFGICSCFLCHGMIQETIISKHRMGASFVLLIQCITNSIVAYLWRTLDGISNSGNREKHFKSRSCSGADDKLMAATTIDHRLLLITSACYVIAMAASNEALSHVSYPTVVLSKSCKMIPTMLMGSVVEHKRYHVKEWLAGFSITFGILIFNFSRIKRKNSIEEVPGNSGIGFSLLLLSLSMDGLLGSCQGLLKRTRMIPTSSKNAKKMFYRPPSAVEMMLYLNLYSILFLIPLTIYMEQWNTGMSMMLRSDVAGGLALLNSSVAIGQIFIFLTVSWFSSLVCTTITTTRKFFTILLSVLYFGHSFTAMQWTAVLSIFSGLYLGITAQKDKAKAISSTHSNSTKKVV